MSIKRPWNFNIMYSNIYMSYEYVETEVYETMALSVAYVGLQLVHCGGTRYLRLEFFRKTMQKGIYMLWSARI